METRRRRCCSSEQRGWSGKQGGHRRVLGDSTSRDGDAPSRRWRAPGAFCEVPPGPDTFLSVPGSSTERERQAEVGSEEGACAPILQQPSKDKAERERECVRGEGGCRELRCTE